MVSPIDITRCLINTFDQSAAAMFRKWLVQYPRVTKWIIAADYSLCDPGRHADCFVFTIYPYSMRPQAIEADIRHHLPKDFKNSKTMSKNAVAWLRDSRRFNIAILVNRNRSFYNDGHSGNSRVVAREKVRLVLDGMSKAERGKEQIGSIKKLNQAVQARMFNINLLTNLTLLAIWFPTLTLLLARERRMKIIGWLSDRDDMISWCDGIIWFYALENLRGLAKMIGVKIKDLQTPIFEPDRSTGDEVMWYDDYIRPADWIAGVLAAWDRVRNVVPGKHDKHLIMLQNVVSDNRNIVIFPVSIDNNGISITRLVVSGTH